MNIKLIKWQETMLIRQEVLWPNKELSFSKVEGDEKAQHYGVFVENKLVSVASVFFQKNQVKFRKFATLDAYQGQGIGKKLFQHILEEVKSLGFSSLYCDARVNSLRFYEKFSLKQEGKEFKKSGISYIKMQVNFKEKEQQ